MLKLHECSNVQEKLYVGKDVIILNSDQDTGPEKLHGRFYDDTSKCNF